MIAAMTLSVFFALSDGEKEYPMQYSREVTPKACQAFADELNKARGIIMKPEGGETGMVVVTVARCIHTEQSLM